MWSNQSNCMLITEFELFRYKPFTWMSQYFRVFYLLNTAVVIPLQKVYWGHTIKLILYFVNLKYMYILRFGWIRVLEKSLQPIARVQLYGLKIAYVWTLNRILFHIELKTKVISKTCAGIKWQHHQYIEIYSKFMFSCLSLLLNSSTLVIGLNEQGIGNVYKQSLVLIHIYHQLSR